MLIFDGHLDLAMNALDYNRDLTVTAAELRQVEHDLNLKHPRSGRSEPTFVDAVVTYPEMRRGHVALCLATLLARVRRQGNPLPGKASPAIAHAWAQGHLAYYRERIRQGTLRMITCTEDLDAHLREWETSAESAPLGFILTMEGADPIVEPEQVHVWKEQGLRALSLSHYGVNRYAYGTHTEGGLTDLGRALLPEMRAAGLLLDLTHTADQAFWEAIEAWDGPVQCSHQNARALVPDQRQMSDDQLRAVIERGGVIGAALDAWMLVPGWVRGQSSPETCHLSSVVDQIDHICQLAGNTRHAAIGSDLDGGFGKEQCPHDLETICDLRKLGPMLRARGYSEEDVVAIFSGNLVNLFRRVWAG